MRLKEELLQQVKEIAVARGVTVSFLVEQFLRQLVQEQQEDTMHIEFEVEQA